MNTIIPETWPMVRLRDVASIRYGKALHSDRRDAQGTVHVYGSSQTSGLHDVAYHDKPSIIIGRKGSVGSIQYVDVPFWPIDTVFFLDEVSPHVDLRYLAAALSHFGLDRYKIVVGVPGLNRDDLASFTFPLPPLSEQQRIVDILQEAEAIRRLRAQAEAKTAELGSVIFDQVFGPPSMWKAGPKLGEIVRIVGGGTPSKSVEHYFRGNIPWATSKDVKKLYLDDTEDHVTEEAVQSSATNIVPVGTVLVVVKSKILAHSLPMAINQVPMCFGQDLKGLIPTDGIPAEFLVYSLQAQVARVLSRARGANTEGLTLEALKSLSMPEPNPDHIKRFIRACAEVRAIGELSHDSDALSAKVSASLSAHAFSGQLTADWREANEKKLATEARGRDAALQQAGKPPSLSRRATIQELDAIFALPTDGQYAELNREQRALFEDINRMVGGVDYARYFTSEQLAGYVTGPLQRHPQAIESHLQVFAIRGLIIPVSRQRSDITGERFAACYRLPISGTPEENASAYAELSRSTDDVKASRMKHQRNLATGHL